MRSPCCMHVHPYAHFQFYFQSTDFHEICVVVGPNSYFISLLSYITINNTNMADVGTCERERRLMYGPEMTSRYRASRKCSLFFRM